MDKSYVEVDACVMVPVKVRVHMTLRTDNDADLEKAVKRFSKGKSYKKADVEDVGIVHWDNFEMEDALQQAIEQGHFEFESLDVVEAK